jgi:hypothetical protein
VLLLSAVAGGGPAAVVRAADPAAAAVVVVAKEADCPCGPAAARLASRLQSSNEEGGALAAAADGNISSPARFCVCPSPLRLSHWPDPVLKEVFLRRGRSPP